MFVDSGDMDDMEYYVEHVFAVLRELDAETSKCYIIARRTTMRGARQPCANVLARHALWRYDNAFLQNENAILTFQITPFWRFV